MSDSLEKLKQEIMSAKPARVFSDGKGLFIFIAAALFAITYDSTKPEQYNATLSLGGKTQNTLTNCFWLNTAISQEVLRDLYDHLYDLHEKATLGALDRLYPDNDEFNEAPMRRF